MPRVIRLLLAVFVVLTALVPSASAAAALRLPPRPAPGFELDGMSFGYLPAGLGATSDFAYHFQRVDFVARVWESHDADGFHVDLDVDVMRGKRLTSGSALHDWFISYDQRPPAEAHYVPVRVHGHPAWRCQDQVLWLVRPGLAVSVQLDARRWSRAELMRLARSAQDAGG